MICSMCERDRKVVIGGLCGRCAEGKPGARHHRIDPLAVPGSSNGQSARSKSDAAGRSTGHAAYAVLSRLHGTMRTKGFSE